MRERIRGKDRLTADSYARVHDVRQVLASLLVVAAAVGSLSATAAGPPAAQGKPAAGVSLDGLEGGEKLRALLAAVVAKQRVVRSLRADFTQVKKSALLLDPIESRGEFAFRAPDTVRWDYVAPEKMVVLLADNLLITFLPDRHRAEEVKLSGRHRRFVAVLAGTQPLDDLAQSFSITFADPGGAAPYRLTLVPTQSVIRRKLRSVLLEVDREQLLPVVVEYNEADGDSTRYEFRHLEVNPELEEGRFRLELGADVQVDKIDASAGLG
jgi:outer membrane lipoprotein-sorting protein